MVRTSEAISEGLHIAWAAARLAVKNVILVDTIARDERYDVAALMDRARAALIDLAEEQEAIAEVVHESRQKAKHRHGDPGGTHDYHDRDLRNLRKRERQYRGVAEHLRRWAGDDGIVKQLVEQARESAWVDVERNLNRRFAAESLRAEADPDYDTLRDERMSSIALVDLEELRESQRVRGHLPEALHQPDAAAADARQSDAGPGEGAAPAA